MRRWIRPGYTAWATLHCDMHNAKTCYSFEGNMQRVTEHLPFLIIIVNELNREEKSKQTKKIVRNMGGGR